MREYVWSQAFKAALSGHLGISVKLYPEEAKALVQEGFKVDYFIDNRYTVSWSSAINENSSEEISNYIYGKSDEFPKSVTKPNQRLSIIALRAYNCNK